MRKAFSRIIATTLIAAVTFSVPCYTQKDTGIVKAAEQYELVWSDEFDGNSLNRSIWNVEENGDGGGNQELQYYRDSSENIEVSGGTLKIKALKKGYGGKGYTSGRINTKGKAEFRYGRIEAKMKLPSFQGAWPAFWTLGGNHSEVGWPRCGEIDIMEAINTEKFTHGAFHWFADGKADSGGNSKSVVSESFDRTQWHVYALEWDEHMMKWLVDDQVFFTQPITDGYMGECRKPNFIILNLAIGGQWPGFNIDGNAFPAKMEVDYVRVLQKASDRNIITGSGVQEKRPSMIPDEIESRDVLEVKGPWQTYFNYAVVKGNGTSKNSTGFTTNIDYLGITTRAIKAYIKDIEYIPGRTYHYSFTMISDIDKNVLVKVVGEDLEEDLFANHAVSLEAGKPYHFSKDITIDKEYDGRLDLIVEMGGRTGGEFHNADQKLKITMENASFTGEAEKLKEIPTERPTESEETDINPTKPIETTAKPTEGIVKPTTKGEEVSTTKVNVKRAVIRSTKRISARKAKISLKKLKGVSGYVVKYSTNKAFKKRVKTKYFKTKIFTMKGLQPRKKYYVKVRAYKKIRGRKYFGRWSTGRVIKIKK